MPPKKVEKQGSSNTDSSECTSPHLTFSPNHYNHYSAMLLLLFSVLASKCLHEYIALKYSAKQYFQNWDIFRSSALWFDRSGKHRTYMCFSLQLSCMNAWEFKNTLIGPACNGAPANEQARVCKSSGMTGQWMKSYPSANIAFQAKLIPSDG